MSKKIGFIGVGMMGHGIAKNLLEKGFPVTAMAHRNRAPLEDLLEKGAQEAVRSVVSLKRLPYSLRRSLTHRSSCGDQSVENCSIPGHVHVGSARVGASARGHHPRVHFHRLPL